MTKRIITKFTLATIVAFAASACYKVQYKNPNAQIGTSHSVKQKFFLWGALGGEQVDLNKLCPQGVAEIASEHSFIDIVLYSLTGGLYTPVSVEVHCASGVAFRVDQSDALRLSVNEIESGEN